MLQGLLHLEKIHSLNTAVLSVILFFFLLLLPPFLYSLLNLPHLDTDTALSLITHELQSIQPSSVLHPLDETAVVQSSVS